MEMMRVIKRQDLHISNIEMVSHMLAGFDSALYSNFGRFRKSGVAPEVWVAANADQLE